MLQRKAEGRDGGGWARENSRMDILIMVSPPIKSDLTFVHSLPDTPKALHLKSTAETSDYSSSMSF